ncbi:hypothetical protein Pla52o_51340 [Novipirellula galeiformis]|uniref:DUF1449 domain-containing protein n=2 Tax=Novipirellula galeiformis TaxID=2528004 RepID=A0A5C6C0B8_9BACT|nr:hypothetical protein Pla52o_51340 [Novipirellula galeiformis]
MIDLANRMFVGPLWPASLLICLLVVYTILALIGLVDFGFDLPDVDLDVPDAGIDLPDGEMVSVNADFLQGLGGTVVRWTNFGRIPIVLWGGIFSVLFWGISYWLWHTFDAARYSPDWLPSILLSIRNLVIATGITKAVTQPLLGYFVDPPSYDENHMVGASCEITSHTATPEFGQAKFRTNAAPLLLNVRTDGAHLPKGTEVRIIGFEKQKRIYIVTHLPSENAS